MLTADKLLPGTDPATSAKPVSGPCHVRTTKTDPAEARKEWPFDFHT